LKNPLQSEDAMFRLLIYVVILAAVVAAIVLIARAV